ncbi:helix-turn-helix domain-containing protein [Gluconacetobacter diazotrophicus]|uniref:Helix-turn-helix domain-containing protein n=1 Tax=Gluconacetobacter diazotrophicus TaxID=33996 RepID=A0A7W4I809_GLUDI|nr:helix-turn-helix domain-containing protein [Gluconacetobacter diazotrophicus]MBB2157936.1 helix-turn-helix domain-containing protein [Gluconacetobacter diazotrophicus]
MLTKPAQLSTNYVRTHEAARLLGISARTLEKYRCHGTGPTFRKLGGRVVYAIGDLEAWADNAACSSTSDPRYVGARAAGHAQR